MSVVVVAGCASGSPPGTAADAQNPPIDSAPLIDSPPQIDARPQIDAAPPIDAMLPIDAPPPPPDACVPMVTEKLLNPGFDLTPLAVNWTEVRYNAADALVVNQSALGFNAQSPAQYAWLGGYESPSPSVFADDAIYQDVLVPAMTTQLQLRGYVAIGSSDSTTSAYDLGGVFVITPTQTLTALLVDNTDAPTTSMWTQFTYNVPVNVSGQTVRVRIETSSDYSLPTNFVFDSLSLVATHGCP